ncbi:MAG: RNA polymerase sigma factor RpoH [Gammaproteobacteria bacterium]|mgnify:FL=1|nr:RNA polymerase sigma factor RpoH [Gammaproteobacteria bacterium]|tara:strand:+ start:893 stop:1756 length:864 start_codon:yes stop_codon:yes gene_type:complete
MAKELALKNELALMGPMGSLEAYISIVNQTPVLSREEERELAYRFQNENDLDAARKLILSQLRFVVHIARTYSGYGLPLADLIQEGNIGLMKAVKKFNPDRGTRLVTYAVHWIRSEIHEFVFNNWKIVKVATTKAQRKLFFKLRNAKKSIGWLTNDEKKLIAKDLGVKPTDVATMEQRFASVDMPYDLGHTDSDEDYISPAGFLPSPDSDPSSIVENDNWLQGKKEQLSSALEGLDKRSKEILMSRWLTDEKVTLKELAKQYQVSIERIRQIEEEAIQELREHLTEA